MFLQWPITVFKHFMTPINRSTYKHGDGNYCPLVVMIKNCMHHE